MDKATLVEADIAGGERVLQILDQVGFKINVALWLYSSEFEAWRLYIASPVVDADGPKKAYVRLLSPFAPLIPISPRQSPLRSSAQKILSCVR